MAITAYRPTTDLFRTFFDEFPGTTRLGGRLGGVGLLRAPEADMMESQEEIRVMVELPGLRPEDVEVSLENNVLTIAGEKREEREEGKENRWHLSERRYGRFTRSFVLPRDVDQEQIAATFENGVLTVAIPKSERARPRRIEIRSGNGKEQLKAGKSR
jgi:HSP20 family protein